MGTCRPIGRQVPKFLAPFGVGVLYAKEHLLASSLPFLYGGDMIADGQVFPDRVDYNVLPWKYSAGTPNILGVIASAQALRLAADLMGADGRLYFRTEDPVPLSVTAATMDRIGRHTAALTQRAMTGLSTVPGLRILGVPLGLPRSPLVAFTVVGRSPYELADALNDLGVESRAGCHCATLAHHDLVLDPPASCRLSFYLYNSVDDVDRAVDAVRFAVREVVIGTGRPAGAPTPGPSGRHRREAA